MPRFTSVIARLPSPQTRHHTMPDISYATLRAPTFVIRRNIPFIRHSPRLNGHVPACHHLMPAHHPSDFLPLGYQPPFVEAAFCIAPYGYAISKLHDMPYFLYATTIFSGWLLSIARAFAADSCFPYAVEMPATYRLAFAAAVLTRNMPDVASCRRYAYRECPLHTCCHALPRCCLCCCHCCSLSFRRHYASFQVISYHAFACHLRVFEGFFRLIFSLICHTPC